MEKPSFRERLQYRFDNYMARGSHNLILLLIVTSVLLVFFVICIMTVFMREPGSFFTNLWNGYVTLINAWMPEYDPGDPPQTAYLLCMAVIAVIGILFTSILIGIITSMIEEKVVSLRRGNSAVLESGHIVVIGFYSGEYTLLRELVLAAAEEPCTIVAAGEMEKDEMEQLIQDNIELHKNVKIICRSIDIFDPNALERLAVKDAKSIIISPTSNPRVTKILLALSTIIDDTDKVRINGIIFQEEYRLPRTFEKKHNIFTLHTDDTIAMMIARSCTQPGLSNVFREIFCYEGNEFYLTHIDNVGGLSFETLSARLDRAVPLGYARDGKIYLNPPRLTLLEESDDILIFAETRNSYSLAETASSAFESSESHSGILGPRLLAKVCIFGSNKSLKIILRELPAHVREVLIVNPQTEPEETEKLKAQFPKLRIETVQKPVLDEEALLGLAEKYHHFIILSYHSDDDERDDMRTSFLLLRLRDIRERYNLSFNITAELHKEANQVLVEGDDSTDFVVGSNMASLFLTQLAESPELLPVFAELLSHEGNEICLIKAKYLNAAGSYTVGRLRQICLRYQFILIGYINFQGEYRFNPELSRRTAPGEDDYLILIGNDEHFGTEIRI